MNGPSTRLAPWPALAVLVACVTTPVGQKVTDKTFEFSSYTVNAPEGGNWGVVALDRTRERVTFQRASVNVLSGATSSTSVIDVFRVPVAPQGWSMSEEEHANAYRDNEERIMIEQGVKKGQYTLKNVRKGEETVGGKKLYFMRYETESGSWLTGKLTTEAVLYLYFPPDYYAAHHAFFGVVANAAWSSVDSKQIEGVIASLELKQPSPR